MNRPRQNVARVLVARPQAGETGDLTFPFTPRFVMSDADTIEAGLGLHFVGFDLFITPCISFVNLNATGGCRDSGKYRA